MLRILVLLATAAALILPTTASAVITPTNDARTLADAIASSGVTSAAFVELPPSGTPHATSDSALAGFPISGSTTYAILTTGDANLADDLPDTSPVADVEDGGAAGHGFKGAEGNAHDTSVLRITLNVPDTASCLSFDFRFLSEEWPDNVGTVFNDGFLAGIDRLSDTADTAGDISSPDNFAFDGTGAIVSSNTAAMSYEAAAGTTYEGATQLLHAQRSVTSGPHTLYLAVSDGGDEQLDSAVFVDNLQFSDLTPAECNLFPNDTTAPAPTLTTPASGASTTTPSYGGQAGEAARDSANVTVQVYTGPSATGTPVDVQTTTRLADGSWSADGSGALPPGQYTAEAHQTDAAGNVGVSAHTFTVVAQEQPTPTPVPTPAPTPAPTPEPSPAPVLGKSVVAGVVSGTVRIKGRNGKFRTLGANESIPLGSTVDATKGKVRLTAAAGSGKTQSGLFYQGAFIVTQTGGAKPVTQLALTGKLSCPKGKASSSARKKKVRRLWGDGKGRFRTKGRYGAATVRGTKWLTEDRCNGTLVRVKRGVVAVRDLAKRKTVLVRKGKSYLARPKKKR